MGKITASLQRGLAAIGVPGTSAATADPMSSKHRMLSIAAGVSILVAITRIQGGGFPAEAVPGDRLAAVFEPAEAAHGKRERTEYVSVLDFLPAGYVKDGSVNYQAELQKAIDTAAEVGQTLIFPPMVYRIDESGLRLQSHLTLRMDGAVFRLDKDRSRDGQAFLGRDVVGLRISGGEIVGTNDGWAEGINIRGIYLTGRSRDIRIRDMHIHGLSSNGIGIFGDVEHPARDVWITDTVIEDSCNRYGDYQSDDPGPETGSVREDQGLIAFYHVRDFVVRGCRLEKSRSDGTHFYRCRAGQFVHNKVYAAKMGGYFLETCEDVTASDNLIRDNGSRGVTIERGSRNCTLQGNLVAGSGREGLWAPDSIGLIVTGNIFDRNGRKPNGPKPHTIWNANITVNEARGDPTNSPTEDYLIADNILYTTGSQIAAIRVDAEKATDIVIKDNVLRGEDRRILVEGEAEGRLVVKDNT